MRNGRFGIGGRKFIYGEEKKTLSGRKQTLTG